MPLSRRSLALHHVLCSPLAFVGDCVHNALTNIECQEETFAHMTKDAAISVRVTEAVKKAAEKAARDDNRSVASLVEKFLVEKLRATGYLK
jgi:hypothetical protein